MKTKTTGKTEKSVVSDLRKIRDQISLDIMHLSPAELKQYMVKKDSLHKKEWKKSSK